MTPKEFEAQLVAEDAMRESVDAMGMVEVQTPYGEVAFAPFDPLSLHGWPEWDMSGPQEWLGQSRGPALASLVVDGRHLMNDALRAEDLF